MIKLKSLVIAGFLIILAAAKGFAAADFPIEEAPAPSYFNIIVAKLSVVDPIQDAVLPILRSCRTLAKPLKAILLESEETAIIHGIEVTYRVAGFLPFYTHFYCTGARLTIEILADILYSHRDCKKHRCNALDEHHLIRMAKFRENTGRFLTRSQELFENEVMLRQRSIIQWTEMVLDGSIIFLESLYEE
jgi:hypothetical protein